MDPDSIRMANEPASAPAPYRSHDGIYDVDAILDAREQLQGSQGGSPNTTEDERGRALRTRTGRRASEGARSHGCAERKRSVSRESRESGTPAQRPRKRRIIGVAAIIVALVVAACAFAYCASINDNLHRGVDDELRSTLVQTDMANEPFYILLLGTDASEEREEYEDFEGVYRSDTIILARIDAPSKKATLVSIHRDTQVDMGEYGIQKINAAYSLGGPALAVKEVSEMAGVPISHYADIDFDAFREMVDALGGIEVDVPVDIDDDDAGGSLHAGWQTLNGDQALILCRSRHTYEGVSADPDMMRSANQRLVLSAIARKILDSDVATIANAVSMMSTYVTTDLDLNDIVGLAQGLQGLDPETDIYSAMEPADAVYEGDLWWMVTRDDEWRAMMERVDAGLPPTENGQVDEVTGTVVATAGGTYENAERASWISVQNGTKKDGWAMTAAGMLDTAGFPNVVVGNADSSDYEKTLVVYDEPAQAYEAQAIANAIGKGQLVVNDGSYVYDGDFLVILGFDWNPNAVALGSRAGE